MKQNLKILVLAAMVIAWGLGTGCDRDIDGTSGKGVKSSEPTGIDVTDPLKDLGYWKSVKNVEGEANSVTINLNNDVDYLAWTKENGEFLSLPIPKGMKFDATFKYTKGPHTFTFKEPGVYILNIHPTKTEDINNGDLNYRGKVRIGETPLFINNIEKSAAGTSPKLAVYIVTNNSKYFGDGNVITEFLYVEYVKQQYDRERKDNFGIYDTRFKYSGFNLQPGEQLNLLFPEKNFRDSRVSGLILKPIIEGNKTVFHGQTVNRTKGSYAMTGMQPDQTNGRFYPIGNGQFECVW